MSESDNQVKAFEFLRQKFESQELFTAEEFQQATGFGDVSFKTYLSKQFRGLLLKASDDKLRVSGLFRRFNSWPKFRDEVVSQRRQFGRAYDRINHDAVVIFEFFMPLRNEEILRQTLDSLFYRDSIRIRLKLIEPVVLRSHFASVGTETEDEYLDRVCSLISEKIIGYSVHHVSGRFRAAPLMGLVEGRQAERYLVDETTAVVTFIIPCVPEEQHTSVQVADRVRWAFQQVFVESILEVVNAEDEIWLLESGMQHQLHIWRAKS